MKLRIAKKVYKNWVKQFEYYIQYGRKESPVIREALNTILSTMGVGVPTSPPKHRRPPNTPKHSHLTSSRAYRRLSKEHQTEWYIKILELRAADRMDHLWATDPMKAATEMYDATMKVTYHLTDEILHEADVNEHLEEHARQAE